MNQNNLKIYLTEIKDSFKESYQDQIIMHMLIMNYDENDKENLSYNFDINEENLYMVVKFISVSNSLTSVFDKLLEKQSIIAD